MSLFPDLVCFLFSFWCFVCSYCILGSEEFLELVKSALQAALEGELPYVYHANVCWMHNTWDFHKAIYTITLTFWSHAALSPGSLFGLLTFSSKIGLYDVQGPIPIVKNVFIPPDSDGALPIDLEAIMPLCSFLAPVCILCCQLQFSPHCLWLVVPECSSLLYVLMWSYILTDW